MYTHKKMKTNSEVALASLKTILPVLDAIEEEKWTLENLHEVVLAKVTELGMKNGQMLWPLRTALSGKQFTPGGAFGAAEILGKKESLERVNKGIELLEKALS